jgi:hypothetical protein
MSRRSRIAVTACAGFAALALGGTAQARYVPKFIVSHANPTVGSPATTISIQLTRDDDATAKVTFYAPLGYRGVLGQAAGTQIGTVAATVQATRISADAILPLSGTVVTDDPAKYTANPCAPGAHAAVWLLRLEAAGQTLVVPVYVDPVSAGPEAAFAQFKLQVCLPSPAIPPEQGGAAFGAKLLTADLTLSQVFAAPATRGQFVWPALFTPYPATPGPPNAAGTVEARAVVRLPAQLTLSGRITNRARRTIRLSGALTENLVGIPAMMVEVLIGGRRAFAARSGSRGQYSIGLRRTGKGRVTSTFRARARVPVRDVTVAGCAGPSLVPGGCVSATAGAFTILSRTVRITL